MRELEERAKTVHYTITPLLIFYFFVHFKRPTNVVGPISDPSLPALLAFEGSESSDETDEHPVFSISRV